MADCYVLCFAVQDRAPFVAPSKIHGTVSDDMQPCRASCGLWIRRGVPRKFLFFGPEYAVRCKFYARSCTYRSTTIATDFPRWQAWCGVHEAENIGNGHLWQLMF